MIRILATIVFVVFGVFAGYATYELGFGSYGIPATTFIMAGLLWEVWIQPVRDEVNRTRLLAAIGDWDYGSYTVNNLQDAQDIITALENRLEAVTSEYVGLKASSFTANEDND